MWDLNAFSVYSFVFAKVTWIKRCAYHPLLLPSFRVHLIEPDFLLTACRFPSSVDTKSKFSGRETVLALQNLCRNTTQRAVNNQLSHPRQNIEHEEFKCWHIKKACVSMYVHKWAEILCDPALRLKIMISATNQSKSFFTCTHLPLTEHC